MKQLDMFGSKVVEVPSMTDPTITYQVDTEKETCTCPAYQKGITRPCKHMKALGIGQPTQIDVGHAKSALQKGFRRNHQELMRWAFDFLWENERTWLLDRLVILAAEDGWKSVLPIGRAIYQFKEDKEKVWTGLVEGAAKKKNQDANGLVDLAIRLSGMDEPERKHLLTLFKNKGCRLGPLLQLLPLSKTEKLGFMDMKPEWEKVWNQIDGLGHHLSKQVVEDLRDLVGAVYFRAKKWGGKETQMLLLAVALLALDEVKKGGSLQAEDSQKQLTDGEFLVEGIVPPWYCLDMYTGDGKRVYYSISKKISMRYMSGRDAREVTEWLWFYMETARVNEKEEGSVWYDAAFKVCLIQHDLDPKEMMQAWKEDIGPEVEARIKKLYGVAKGA